LLDTGSDGTLVPITYLRRILAPVLTNTRIRSHWGEWRPVQLFVVDVVIDGLRLPGIFVVGDEQGDEIVLGRDVLNRLRLLLDGPAQTTDVLIR
jgi:predicted aspartyl protease